MKVKGIIGREKELDHLEKLVSLGRNVLIEGPVGVGKTYLVQTALGKLDKDFIRVDGDTRYTEQKLTGWFDPPLVLKKGYDASTFVEGPLVTAMKKGRLLFINELNRMPEAVQNILLPAMDERRISVPKIGEIHAKKGFAIIATQNPREFTATHALSEALLDRFEMIALDYQSAEDEGDIVSLALNSGTDSDTRDRSVELIRQTRKHSGIKRGASVRAAIAICELIRGGLDFETAAVSALSSRIELVSSDDSVEAIIRSLVREGLLVERSEKKKTSRI